MMKQDEQDEQNFDALRAELRAMVAEEGTRGIEPMKMSKPLHAILCRTMTRTVESATADAINTAYTPYSTERKLWDVYHAACNSMSAVEADSFKPYDEGLNDTHIYTGIKSIGIVLGIVP
jgi:hypothetical protein